MFVVVKWVERNCIERMKLFLIRHGTQISKLCNDNTSLSEQGKEEAYRLGNRLADYQIDCIYSSHLLRAVETAELIKERIQEKTGNILEIQIREELQECDFGRLTGLKDEVIADIYQDFMESRYHVENDWAYPDGESGQEVYERFYSVIKEMIALYPNKNIAIVTHGGAIRAFLAEIMQQSQKNRLMFGKQFRRGSLTEVYYEEETKRFYLERFNDYGHLE